MTPHFLAFDTETGGLKPHESDLLTAYFVVLTADLQPLDEGLYLKLRPANLTPRVTPGAMAVNGIDLKKHVEEAVTYGEGLQQLTDMLKKHVPPAGKLIPMGHNVPFDCRFVHSHLMDIKDWTNFCSADKADTYDIAKRLQQQGKLPGISNLKLTTLVEYFNLPRGTAHNARNDTIMTVFVLRELRRLATET